MYLDVSIDVPDKLDIGFLRGTGLQPHEEELPEEAAQAGEGKEVVGLSLYQCFPSLTQIHLKIFKKKKE